MDEIKKNDRVEICFCKNTVKGSVVDYTSDRVMVVIDENDIEISKQILELQDVNVKVYTKLGEKQMESTIISQLNNKNCIIFENNETAPIIQKREFVRVVSDFNFDIVKNNAKIPCTCLNISSGGIAFSCNCSDFSLNEEVRIEFYAQYFGQDLSLEARIIKVENHSFIAKFINTSAKNEDCILKFVFKTMTK